MNQIVKYLHQPYPCSERTRKTIAVISLLVCAVLFVFQPFGIGHIPAKWRYWIILGYGVVTAVVMCLQIYLLPLAFPRFYGENHWTVGRNIFNTVITILFVTLGNIAYGYALGITWQHFNTTVLLSALLITTAVGILPVVLVTVLRQNRLLAISLHEAEHLNKSLAADGDKIQEVDRLLTFCGMGKGDVLEMSSAQLFYIEACGNYVKVNYLKEDAVAQKILRTTIKQIEDATVGYPHITKCHRAFLVNLGAIRKVSGNSQGYRLMLHGIEKEIPVSRAYTSIVKAKLAQL